MANYQTNHKKVQKVQPDSEIISYPFPLQVAESIHMKVSNAHVAKAVLKAGDTILSSYIPTSQNSEGETELRFFEDTPFHAALASKWNVTINVQIDDGKIPSLTFMPVDNSVTWDTVASDVYCEDVKVWSDTDLFERTMVYTPTRGGFKR